MSSRFAVKAKPINVERVMSFLRIMLLGLLTCHCSNDTLVVQNIESVGDASLAMDATPNIEPDASDETCNFSTIDTTLSTLPGEEFKRGDGCDYFDFCVAKSEDALDAVSSNVTCRENEPGCSDGLYCVWEGLDSGNDDEYLELCSITSLEPMPTSMACVFIGE